ncbi:hypothetical protein IFM89_000487 [Coptis chinensis]|uniref:Sugar phosphate transporter domain-containing protein n=1 Tax=Coptis chinensis TaxID=261450 RepID=A0A835H386_9MAGN|nr:hypothetical protein IFM89_000487 [Coptis chinensis]
MNLILILVSKYTTSVIPIGAMFAMMLWLGNTAYMYISVTFAQMLKAIMPVAVFILGVAAGLELMSYRMFFIMPLISFGILVASYGEVNVNWIGVVYQMGGVVGEVLRLIFMEIFMKRKGLKLNPISVMSYVSPCSALCLFISWIFLEVPKMNAIGPWSFQPLVLTLNSLCTFALNLSVFLVISHTSALTIRVAGVVKDWVVVLLSAFLFVDTKLTVINLFGYGIGRQIVVEVLPISCHIYSNPTDVNIGGRTQITSAFPSSGIQVICKASQHWNIVAFAFNWYSESTKLESNCNGQFSFKVYAFLWGIYRFVPTTC